MTHDSRSENSATTSGVGASLGHDARGITVEQTRGIVKPQDRQRDPLEASETICYLFTIIPGDRVKSRDAKLRSCLGNHSFAVSRCGTFRYGRSNVLPRVSDLKSRVLDANEGTRKNKIGDPSKLTELFLSLL